MSLGLFRGLFDLRQKVSPVLNQRQDVHSQSQRPLEHLTEVRGSLTSKLALEPRLVFIHSDSKETEWYPASLQLRSDSKGRLVLVPSPGHLTFVPTFDPNWDCVAIANEGSRVLDDLRRAKTGFCQGFEPTGTDVFYVSQFQLLSTMYGCQPNDQQRRYRWRVRQHFAPGTVVVS